MSDCASSSSSPLKPKSSVPVGVALDASFNPVDYVNSCFADGNLSLTTLEAHAAAIHTNIARIDKELVSAVQAQALVGCKVGSDLSSAKKAMEGLFARVTSIKLKADESENMVQEICEDIRALDNSKRNITSSIQSLKSAKELESFIAKLQSYVGKDDFKEAAPLVEAAGSRLEGFGKIDVPKINHMKQQVNALRMELNSKIMYKYSRYDPTIDGAPPPELQHAAQVLEALGNEARKAFIQSLIQNILEKYQRSFHRGEDAALLANATKRYHWFRRYLQEIDEHLTSMFPPHWCFAQEMAVEFCLCTNTELRYQLKSEAASMDPVILIKALQKSIDFEKELSKKWAIEVDVPEESSGSDDEDFNELGESERVRAKYLRHSRQKQRAERREERRRDKESTPSESKVVKSYKFYGFITSAFEGSMHLYVKYEDTQMQETIDRLIAEETWGGSEEEDLISNEQILISASDLFIYVHESFKRGSTLSQGPTLSKLQNIWCKNLVYYTTKIISCLPKGGQEKDDRVSCLVINTGDYWSGIMSQLEDEVRSKIEEISRNEVNLDPASDAFAEMIKKGMRNLIRSVDLKLETGWNDMLKINWFTMSCLDDHSTYVTTLGDSMVEKMKCIFQYLNPQYIRSFCDRFVSFFVGKFVQQIYRCKRIANQGCQQLMLDVQTLKAILQDLPLAGNVDRFSPSQLGPYNKGLSREIQKLEAILKIVMTASTESNMATEYAELCTQPSIPEFVKLMELRGMKRSEMAPYIDQLASNKNVSKTETNPTDAEDGVQLARDVWKTGMGQLDNWKTKFDGLKIPGRGVTNN